MELLLAQSGLTTRMGRVQYILSPRTPTPARIKVKGGHRPAIAAGGGEAGGTRIDPRGVAVVVGGMATAAVIVARAVEVEVVAPKGGVGTLTRPGERTTTRKALWEHANRPETL